jgi:hypothetical protein
LQVKLTDHHARIVEIQLRTAICNVQRIHRPAAVGEIARITRVLNADVANNPGDRWEHLFRSIAIWRCRKTMCGFSRNPDVKGGGQPPPFFTDNPH